MSMFDPSIFLDATLEAPTEKRPPLPVGDYTAVVGEVKARAWQGRTDPTKSGIAWDIPLAIEIPAEVQAQLGLQVPTLNLVDSLMLDLTEGGTIDNSPGKNRRLRIWRDAVDLNKQGDSFSARKMTGKVVRIKISHDVYDGAPVEKISGVARA